MSADPRAVLLTDRNEAQRELVEVVGIIETLIDAQEKAKR